MKQEFSRCLLGEQRWSLTLCLSEEASEASAGGQGPAQGHLGLSRFYPGWFPLYYSVLAQAQGFAKKESWHLGIPRGNQRPHLVP